MVAVAEAVQVYGMQHALKVCDAYNEVQRLKEELQLLPQEMLAHLQYWESVLDKQERLVALLSTRVSSAEAQQQLAQQLHAAGLKVCCWLERTCHPELTHSPWIQTKGP